METLAKNPMLKVRYVAIIDDELATSGAPTCVDFPMHDRSTRKKIGWSRVCIDPKTWRLRRVAIAEVEATNGVCYVLEAERVKKSDKLATLVLAHCDFRRISGKELDSMLTGSAAKGSWMSQDQLTDYRRARATHQRLVSVDVFAERILDAVKEVLGVGGGTRSDA